MTTQSISWGRIGISLAVAVAIMSGCIAMNEKGKRDLAYSEDPNNQTIMEKADRGTFGFAYRRNMTAEAVANGLMATKQDFVGMTAYIILQNPGIDNEEAARLAVFEIQRRNRLGVSILN